MTFVVDECRREHDTNGGIKLRGDNLSYCKETNRQMAIDTPY
jgi:hypothetical protein